MYKWNCTCSSLYTRKIKKYVLL